MSWGGAQKESHAGLGSCGHAPRDSSPTALLLDGLEAGRAPAQSLKGLPVPGSSTPPTDTVVDYPPFAVARAKIFASPAGHSNPTQNSKPRDHMPASIIAGIHPLRRQVDWAGAAQKAGRGPRSRHVCGATEARAQGKPRTPVGSRYSVKDLSRAFAF